MNSTNQLFNFRSSGTALLVATIVFMVGAYVADYFRLPIPTDSLEKLQRIANDRLGWTEQAIIFPVSFLAITIVFGQMTTKLPAGWPRW